VIEPCAGDLGAMVEAQMGRKVRYYAHIYDVLGDPVARLHHEAALLLTPDDHELVEVAVVRRADVISE
jgi:hypothetical protein